MKIVSACLCGVKCRYDGKGKANDKIIEMVKKGEAIPVCPEQIGGLTTPRVPAEEKDTQKSEISGATGSGGKIITTEGKDVTENFERGAEEALKIALLSGCDEAILKEKSPSCGVKQVYDGSFTGTLKAGDGIFTRLLKKNGIKVKSEEDI